MRMMYMQRAGHFLLKYLVTKNKRDKAFEYITVVGFISI